MKGFELKTISSDGIPHALAQAEHYRLLSDPAHAESICRDVLAVEPDNQHAVRSLILAVTDQFGSTAASASAHEAQQLILRLTDEYERAYYTGIVFERETRSYLEGPNVVRSAALDGLRQAMNWYQRAETLRPAGNIDAQLRWNSCVRAIERERLEPDRDPA